MKIIIAGSRSIVDYTHVEAAMKLMWTTPTEVVSGGARGVDKLGEMWAAKHNIPVKVFPANWNKYGKRAGFLRNEEMGHYADGAVIVWDGQSRGAMHMRNFMKSLDKPVFVYQIGGAYAG